MQHLRISSRTGRIHIASLSVLALLLAMPTTALAGPSDHYAYWLYGPDWGKSDIYFHYGINRPFADTETYWSSAVRVSGMDRDSSYVNAYEHQMHFYNYDDTAYAVAAEGYWTTLPGHVYLDTTLSDNPNEPNPTIGTSDADQLQAQVYYMMDFVLIPNTPPSGYSRVKIREERGRRPVGCWSKWCVTSWDAETVVEFSDWYTAPGYIHWHF